MTGLSLRIRIPHSVTRTTPLRDTVMFLVLLVISTFAAGDALCYEANTTSFFYCQQQQYDSWGFHCVGESCAASHCDTADCQFCTDKYADAVLDSRTGRCCKSLDPSGACVDPKQGKAPIPLWGYSNYTYFGIGGLVAHPGAASTWSDDNPTGAYAMSVMSPGGWFHKNYTKDSDCPAIPDDARHLDPTRLKPFVLSTHLHDPHVQHTCLLGCNLAQIRKTGVDPCNAGSIKSPQPIEMGCYYGGNNWLDIPELGFCGFGCSLRRITTHAQDCRQKDLDAGLCIVDCGVSSAEDRMTAVAPWRPAVGPHNSSFVFSPRISSKV
eukprot:g13816.t1